MMHDDVAILLLAAGASSRMGDRDKLLEQIDGVPLLRRQAMNALATPARVFVTLAPDRPERIGTLHGLNVFQIEVIAPPSAPFCGMSDSIAAGVKALPSDVQAVAVLPADMPDITAQDLTHVLETYRETPDQIHRAASETGTLGHPVIFPKRVFPALRNLSGDLGARDILRGEQVIPINLPGDHAITDLDTPKDWVAWRKQRTPDR